MREVSLLALKFLSGFYFNHVLLSVARINYNAFCFMYRHCCLSCVYRLRKHLFCLHTSVSEKTLKCVKLNRVSVQGTEIILLISICAKQYI